MIYKFKSKAAGDVLMLGPNGDRVLGLIGKAPGPQGIIEPAQMPDAIEALLQAIVADEAARAEQAQDEERPRGDAVSLRQRAWPLIEMMRRALAADEAVVWGV